MDLGAVLFSLALALLAGGWVLQPMYRSNRSKPVGQLKDQSELLAERDRLLDAIQDLDSDSAMGKVTEVEYAQQRESLTHEAAEVLRRLDEAQAADPVDAELERRVAGLRQASTSAEAKFCHNCGQAIAPGDKFCSNCGTALEDA